MTLALPVDAEDFPPAVVNRPVWLITLADLALLLVGFFVLLQANQSLDRHALAAGFRARFAADATPAKAAAPMPLAVARVQGFAPGSATMDVPPTIIAWARDATRDPRTALVITGYVDGSAGDVDPMTGSAALLAADRARMVAARLARDLPHSRLIVASDPGNGAAGRRDVVIELGFAGNRQDAAAQGRAKEGQ